MALEPSRRRRDAGARTCQWRERRQTMKRGGNKESSLDEPLLIGVPSTTVFLVVLLSHQMTT
jgi:hypothetical protein